MLKYCETTTLILAWCFGLSLVWAWVVFVYTARRSGTMATGSTKLGAGMIFPALVAGPMTLLFGFRLLGINFLYPVHFFVELRQLVAAAFAPAVVLVISSGLLGSLARRIVREYQHWQGKTFALMAKASGQSQTRALRRLVMMQALTASWSQCLPWLFGELVIIEVVFNAPGLGLDAWHLARQRDLLGVAEVIGWLAALYVLCIGTAALLARSLGRRLESYG